MGISSLSTPTKDDMPMINAAGGGGGSRATTRTGRGAEGGRRPGRYPERTPLSAADPLPNRRRPLNRP
jgi:hypothetical protein